MSKIFSNIKKLEFIKCQILKKFTSVFLLVFYGSTLGMTPLAIAADNILNRTTLVPYSVIGGDTVFSLAKKHGLKPEQLVLLNKNATNPIANDFNIEIGQVIYVPNGKVIALPTLDRMPTKDSDVVGFMELDKFVAQQLIRQGNNFTNNDNLNGYSQAINKGGAQTTPQDSYNQWLQQNGGEPQNFNEKKYTLEDEKRFWRQQVSSKTSQISQDFIRDNLSGFGTVKTELIFDENFNVTNFGLDVLAPLHDTESLLVFAQIGAHHIDSTNKTSINFGLGNRYFFEQWMLGYSVFFDTTLENSEINKHQRLGIGIESWADYFKFGVNYYSPLSGWKDSKLFNNYEERAAEGFDIRLDYYLSSYPQLGLNAKYEQYFGNEVDIMGNKQLKNDPYSTTVGVEWQPIPLISFNVDHTEAKGGQSNTQAAVNFEWKMGASLNDMLDPDKVAGSRSMKGMRYDLVQRNNNIVLEYREKQTKIEISHPAISGVAGDKVTLSPDVKISGDGEITHWEWYSPDEKIQQGLSSALSKNPELTLPELPFELEEYETSIYLKVMDNNGKVHYSAAIPITVKVNPNSYVKRIAIPDLGVDSKENSTTELSIEHGQYIDVKWFFVRQSLSDEQQYAVKKPEKVDFQVSEGYEVEEFDGEYVALSLNGNKKSDVWRNNFRIKSTSIQTHSSKAKSDLPVVQLKASDKGGVHVETVILHINSNVAIDPNAMPQISNLRIVGKLEVGESLEATYAFEANGGDVNDKSTYAWGNQGETAAVVSAGSTVTASGEVPMYLLKSTDVGEVKEVSVQAKNGLDVTGNTVTVDSGMDDASGNGTTGGADNNGDDKGDTVIDASKIKVRIDLTSTATLIDNGVDGINPVVRKDVMTAECKIDGEAQFTKCDNRFDLQWKVGGEDISGETASTFTAKSKYQGKSVQVEVTLKP